MPFGLQNAPHHISEITNRILIPHQQDAVAYFNSIAIHSITVSGITYPRCLRCTNKKLLTASPQKIAIGLEKVNKILFIRSSTQTALLVVESYNFGTILVKQSKSHPRVPMSHKQETGQSLPWYNQLLQKTHLKFCNSCRPIDGHWKRNNFVMVKWFPEAEIFSQMLKRAFWALPIVCTPEFSNNFVI